VPDFEKMYHIMFNAATNAERLLWERRTEEAMALLQDAQRTCEEMYVGAADEA
jgi:hypothetical protein